MIRFSAASFAERTASHIGRLIRERRMRLKCGCGQDWNGRHHFESCFAKAVIHPHASISNEEGLPDEMRVFGRERV